MRIVRPTLQTFTTPVAIGISQVGIQLRLRACIVGGSLLALLAVIGAGGSGLPWIVSGALLVAAVVAAVRPDTHAGLVLLGLFCWVWLAHVDSRDSPWTLVAALGLAVFHVACSAAALGPREAELGGAIWMAWLRRLAVVLAGTAVVWVLAALMVSADSSANALLTGIALVMLAVVGWLAGTRSTEHDPTADLPES